MHTSGKIRIFSMTKIRSPKQVSNLTNKPSPLPLFIMVSFIKYLHQLITLPLLLFPFLDPTSIFLHMASNRAWLYIIISVLDTKTFINSRFRPNGTSQCPSLTDLPRFSIIFSNPLDQRLLLKTRTQTVVFLSFAICCKPISLLLCISLILIPSAQLPVTK